jgi:hypothetical protein
MRTDLILDRVDHRIVASAWQDVEPILDRNKALQNEPQGAAICGTSAPSPTSSW